MPFVRNILASLFLLCLLTYPVSGYAQDVHIAVVDLEKILNDSKAGKNIQKQLEDRREAFQKEFSTREDTLMNAEKTLIEQKQTLKPEEFAEKRKDFEKQLQETRNLFQKRRSSLDKGLGNALSELRKNILQVAAEVADEGKYNVVLTRDSVVIVQKEMDITQEVLNRLNKKIDSIKLDVSE